jgi:WD40 repeat protein
MAPEQARGEAVDQRADVFAIGAMLWELCSLQKTPPNESAQRRRLLRRAGIDQDLVAIVDKALDADPRRRYRDAGELASDLKAFKSGARITARSYSIVGTLAHWTRRHRALAALALAFAVVLVGGVIGLAVLYEASSRNAAAARSNAETAHARLIHSYAEQGRHALLEGKSIDATALLAQAFTAGDDSPSIRFMIERAAQPLGAELLRLPSAATRMWSAMFSADGQRIVTTDDKEARVWEASTGRLLYSLPHDGSVFRALYTPDGQRLVTIGGDGFVKVWDAVSGVLVRALTQPPRGNSLVGYRTGAISPDGALVVAMSRFTADMRVWDLRSGAHIVDLPTHATGFVEVSFSPDGRWLVAMGGDEVRVFDTATWGLARTLEAARVRTFAVDATGSRVVTGTSDGDVSVWELSSGRRIQHLLELGDGISRVAYSPDGGTIAAAASDGVVWLWRATSGELRARLSNHQRSVQALEFDPSSQLVLSGASDGRVVLSDVETGLPVSVLAGPTLAVVDAHFDPRAQRVVGASFDGTARIWDAASRYRRWSTSAVCAECGGIVHLEEERRYVALADTRTYVWDTTTERLIADLPGVTGVQGPFNGPFPAVSSMGDLAAIATGNTVAVYELPGGRLVRTIQHRAPVTTVRFGERSHAILSGSTDGGLLVTRDGRESAAFSSSLGAIDVAALLPDGRAVAVDARKQLAVLDVNAGVVGAVLTLPARARALRLSPDGHRLISIPLSGTPAPPVLCDLEQGRVIALLEGHNSQVFSAQFIHEGREILTAGSDGTARIWDGMTGRLKQTFGGTGTYLTDATVSPDDAMVVTAGGDGNVQFWDMASGVNLWSLRAHKSIVSGLHYEGDDLVTRGFTGEIYRWRIPTPASSPEFARRLDRVLRCLPVRFDEATGGLVAQRPACEGRVGASP